MKNIFWILIILVTISAKVTAQDEVVSKRAIGLSASIQASQYGVSIPIWIGNRATIAPSFHVLYAENIGFDSGLGLISKIYINNNKVSPYIGLKFGFIQNTPSDSLVIKPEKTLDLIGGFAIGGEYFFDNNFSISVEIQGNFSKSDKNSYRFGNPDGLNFNTASMISANIYF